MRKSLIFKNSCKLILYCLFLATVQYTNAQGIITTIAGTGTAGFSGDGGAATKAELNNPITTIADKHGNLFILDGSNNCIRKIAPNGITTTIAGIVGTKYGYNGDGILATKSTLAYPTDIKMDRVGNIYIADGTNFRIRKIDTAGIITTIAGTGSEGYSGDGGAATKAEIYLPVGLAVDIVGNVYFSDNSNRVRKIDTSGIITTVAGNGYGSGGGVGGGGYSGDNGQAISAELYQPQGVVVDNTGNIYIADQSNNRIRKVSTNGIITTVVGTGVAGYGGDNGLAANAELNNPVAIAFDTLGNLYISDWVNNRIRKVTNDTITTIAGTGVAGFSGDGGDATAAELNGPSYLCIDSTGNIYIPDFNNNRIRKITYPKPLPLQITSFGATHTADRVQLGWQTATELNTSRFIIQHSTDGSSFTDIGTVKAVGSGANSYSYPDTHPANGINYYRLESVDKDGAATYSKIVSCEMSVVSKQFTIYPNPAKDNVTISGNHIACVQVIDNLGRVVKVVSLKDATNPVLCVSGLAARVYNLKIQTSDGKVSGLGFVKE